MTSRCLEPKVKFCDCWRSSGVEQLPCKQWVGGSNPPASASLYAAFSPTRGSHRMPAGSGRYPSGQREQTVNLLAYAFGGSNPPLPTKLGTTAPRGDRDERTSGNSSAVERQPSKLGVAGSNPVSRSRSRVCAHVAQSAERVLGKDEVSGSIPDMGSRTDRRASMRATSMTLNVIATANGRV